MLSPSCKMSANTHSQTSTSRGTLVRTTWSRFRRLEVASVLWIVMFSCGTSPLLSQENRALPQKIGVIETSELSKLIRERQEEVAKAETAGMTPPPQQFILVDVRTDREMSVSIIPGAISKAAFEKDISKYRGKVVIPYCTVGGRCGEFSRQLAQAGWTVKSYRGSIVEWVQSEQSLVTPAGRPTTQVHTNGGNFKLPAKYQAVIK